MDNHETPGSPSTLPIETPPKPRAIRAGIIAAVLWCAIGVTAAWLSAQAGAPTASGWIGLLSGLVALVLAGRMNDIRRPSDWAGAGVVAVLVVAGIGSLAIFALTMLTAGSGFPGGESATPEGVPPGGIGVTSSDPITTRPLDTTLPPHVPLAMNPSDVAHIVAALDELATAEGDQVVDWFDREAEWVTEHLDATFDENPPVSAYVDQILAALQKMGEGDLDLTAEVTAILALREAIAALAPGAVPTPTS
jgi:hypothetical protein